MNNFQASLVFSISRAEGGLEGPIAGWLIDRFGPRKLMLGGILLSSLGFFAFSQVNSFLSFVVVYLGLIPLGSSVAFQHALFSSLNMWFIRHRALAMSINAAFASLGGVILPLSLIIRPSPESMDLLPDGDRSPERRLPQSPTKTQGTSSSFSGAYADDVRVSEALRSLSY